MTATAWPERQYDDGITAAPWMATEPFPCRRDPDLFFSDRPHDIAAAKSLCGSCPKRVACREYAVEQKIVFGVWGGEDGDERGFELPALPVCTGCGSEVEKVIGGKCLACNRNRLSGPNCPAHAVQSAEREARVNRFCDLRLAGKTRKEAQIAVGVQRAAAFRYEQVFQERHGEQATEETTTVHPWRAGDAVRETWEASA